MADLTALCRAVSERLDSSMKRVLSIFFITLGVIFFILILAVVYLFTFDPLGIREPTPTSADEIVSTTEDAISTSTLEDKNPLLNPTQENALEAIGVDPSSLPSTITPEMEACFIDVLGMERVEEIKAGDLPSALEFLQARECI